MEINKSMELEGALRSILKEMTEFDRFRLFAMFWDNLKDEIGFIDNLTKKEVNIKLCFSNFMPIITDKELNKIIEKTIEEY